MHMEYWQHKGLNNLAENSHQPTWRQEWILKRSKSSRQVQKYLSIHDHVAKLFHFPPRGKMSAPDCRASRDQAFAAWAGIAITQLAA
ncbi:hypothetical protein RZS28_19780 (plasmid) [Methylocapsa polymorpha]|uniref:Transposase n=1 Tax=Methylocapsa polymorpha TaxID=3080828 RepID=A0ABZ0HWN6_9HYPH|nr:hypothetical protein [Methylocapsa sp. RX1]WOJ91687.1 hypothetical protein RZS28_19780 [Methylocapsa sp. RX1]